MAAHPAKVGDHPQVAAIADRDPVPVTRFSGDHRVHVAAAEQVTSSSAIGLLLDRGDDLERTRTREPGAGDERGGERSLGVDRTASVDPSPATNDR
jgi:hypothetical protein